MYNRDYSKEVGLDSGERIVPWRYLLPLLALIAVLGWIGISSLAKDEAGRQATSGSPEGIVTHS